MVVAALIPLSGCCFLGIGDCDNCQNNPAGPSCPQPQPIGQRTLPISPTFQQTVVWCWAASAEMVFRYYGLPNLNPGGNYQCGIVGAWFSNSACVFNCGLCPNPIGPMSNELAVIRGYGPFANTFGFPSRVLSASLIFRALSAAEIKNEIDAGRPVVVGIAPGGGFALPNASQHIAVLVGYEFTASSQTVIVNDPFPFNFAPYSQIAHPYLSRGAQQLQQGQYRVALSDLVAFLGWANSIYQIQ